MLSSQKRVYLFATFVTIFMGHNMVLIKSLLYTVNPYLLAFLRMSFAALTLAILSYVMFGLIKPDRKQMKWLLIASFFGVFIHQMTLAIGLQLSQTTNGALILGLNPLTTTLLGALILKEPLFRQHYIGIFLGFLGICFIVFKGFSSLAFSYGDLFLIISMGTQAFSFVYIRKLADEMPIIPITAYSYILGAAMMLVVPFIVDMGEVLTFTALAWGKIALSGVVLTGLGFVGWNTCIKRLGAGGSSIFLNVITLTGIFGAIVYLGEALYIQHVLGFISISLGIFVATYHKQKKPIRDIEIVQEQG